jgi:hypothetical protein
MPDTVFLEINNRKSDSSIDRETEMIHALPGTQWRDPNETPVMNSDSYINTLQ